MTDIHCHVLPGIDDGSRSVEMSLEMLRELKRQGVDRVIATPHFYPTRNSPERFLRNRQEAYERLMNETDDSCPEISLGAEVMYFEGISRYEGLEDFKAEGTDVILLEMPFVPWTSRAIDEVMRLGTMNGIDLVLAHIERYFEYVKKHVWEDFSGNGILMQANAESILDRKLRRRVLRMIKKGTISFVGTDSHNMSGRAPNIAPAFDEIGRTAGKEAYDRLIRLQERYFGGASE